MVDYKTWNFGLLAFWSEPGFARDVFQHITEPERLSDDAARRLQHAIVVSWQRAACLHKLYLGAEPADVLRRQVRELYELSARRPGFQLSAPDVVPILNSGVFKDEYGDMSLELLARAHGKRGLVISLAEMLVVPDGVDRPETVRRIFNHFGVTLVEREEK